MRLLGDFEARRQTSFARNDEVVVRSERGIEWGVVLCPATNQTSSYLGNSKGPGGRILRSVSDEDRRSRGENSAREKEVLRSRLVHDQRTIHADAGDRY